MPIDRYKSLILATSGLVAYWRLGDSGTTAVDSSGNGNNGTDSGSVTRGVSGLIASSGDKARTYSGGYTDCGAGSTLNLVNDLTVGAWINASSLPTSLGVGKWIVGKDTNTGRSYSFGLYHDGASAKLSLQINGTGTFSTTSIQSGTVCYVAATRSGSTITYYLNAQSIGSATDGTALNVTGTHLRIGEREYPSFEEPFSGTIDEVAIYSRALSASEIAVRYAAGIAAGIGEGSAKRFPGDGTGLLGD